MKISHLIMYNFISKKHQVSAENCAQLKQAVQKFMQCTHLHTSEVYQLPEFTGSIMNYIHTHLQLWLAIQFQMTLLPSLDNNSQAGILTTFHKVQDFLKLRYHICCSIQVFLNHLTCKTTILLGSNLVCVCVCITDKVFECFAPNTICPQSSVVFMHDFAQSGDFSNASVTFQQNRPCHQHEVCVGGDSLHLGTAGCQSSLSHFPAMFYSYNPISLIKLAKVQRLSSLKYFKYYMLWIFLDKSE